MDVSCYSRPRRVFIVEIVERVGGDIVTNEDPPVSWELLAFVRPLLFTREINTRTELSITSTSAQATLKDAYIEFTMNSHSQNGIILEKLDF